MWKLVTGLVALLAALIVLPLVSYYYADAQTTPATFISSLSLNIAAELVGVLVTLLGVVLYAAFAARKKFESLATPIAELIAQLRAERRISCEAARRSMVCAVKLITPEYMSNKANNSFSINPKQRPCDVCDLLTTVDADTPCKDCGLERHIWSINREKTCHSE
jgi:hypothetical protein